MIAVPLVLLAFVGGYYYVTFGRLIDAQLHGERQRVFPRIYARPLELRLGQAMTEGQLVDRLNDIGYAERTTAAKPGEFALSDGKVSIVPRAEEFRGRTVKVSFQKPAPAVQRAARGKPPAKRPADHVETLELGSNATERLTLDTPLLSSLQNERSKRRPVALSSLPPHVVQAVLAIEDRRYYYHPGIDPIRMSGPATHVFTGELD